MGLGLGVSRSRRGGVTEGLCRSRRSRLGNVEGCSSSRPGDPDMPSESRRLLVHSILVNDRYTKNYLYSENNNNHITNLIIKPLVGETESL